MRAMLSTDPVQYKVEFDHQSGAPGLVDRVFAVHAGRQWFDSHRRHMSKQFSDPIGQDIRTQGALAGKKVVSEWRSVIEVSLNVGGCVRNIKPAKLYICTRKHYKYDEDGRTVPCVCGHGSVPLWERRYENWITTTTIWSYPVTENTVGFQWLKHLWNHDQMFETGVVRANECW